MPDPTPHLPTVRRRLLAWFDAHHRPLPWRATRDPIDNFGAWLAREGVATEAELTAVREAVAKEADEAVAYALAAPYPEPSQVTAHVFAEAAHA